MNARLLATLAWSLATALIGSAASAQQTQVYADANDSPDRLINASFAGATMTYGTEIAGSSTTGTAATLAFNQVRVFKSNAPGCSLIAQTHNGGNTVSLYVITASGAIFQLPGSPFFIFGAGGGLQSVAWAPDGGALYVPISLATPASEEQSARMVTFTITCTVGGAITVTNSGTAVLTGIDLPRDVEVIGTGIGSHLCVTGTNSNNLGCFAIAATRLPVTTAASTITVANARGMRIAPNGCGVAGVGNATTVQGFKVNASGILTATNSATTATMPRYGAIAADGSLAAFGGLGNQFTLFSVDASCNLTLVGSNANGIAGSLVEYLAFDGVNRLFVSDSLANQIRVFAPTAGGIGAALSTTNTNHGTTNAPSGIDVALLTSLPVELMEYSID